MKAIILICSLGYPFCFQDENSETFNLCNLLYDIGAIKNDESMVKCISKLNGINKNYLNKSNVTTLNFLLNELIHIKNLDKEHRQIRYKKMTEQDLKFLTTNMRLLNGKYEDLNFASLDKELEDLINVFGSESYWVYNFRVNYIFSKITRNINNTIIDELKICEKFLEDNNLRKGMLGSGTLGAYCLYYEKTGDWEKCEKFALEFFDIYPKHFNENYLTGPVSFLIKSSFMLNKLDKVELYKNVLTNDHIFSHISRYPTLFRINETLGKYYLKKGKIINAISHQEIALVHISKMAPKDSEEVKAVATDLRNMLKQNNEIQSMRNLEERYNLKPLP